MKNIQAVRETISNAEELILKLMAEGKHDDAMTVQDITDQLKHFLQTTQY